MLSTAGFWRRLAPGVLGLSLLLAACGGGGGGDSGPTPPPAGPAFDASYFPLNTGDRRQWRFTSDGVLSAPVSERIGAPRTTAGLTAYEVRDEAGQISYLAFAGTGVTSLPGPGADVLTAALGPVELLRFGLRAGQRAQLFDRTVRTDVDLDGRADTVALAADFQVLGFETVEVPAGRFTGAARVRVDLTLGILYGSGVRVSLSVASEEWYVSGIGRVRSVTTTRVDGGAPSVELEELQAYGVGALRSSTVAPTVSAVTPADGAAADPRTDITLRFSQPLDLADADSDTGLRLIDAAGAVVPVRYSAFPDGRGVVLSPLNPLADGTYRLRFGPALVDWANNAVAGTGSRFVVDTVGPRLASSAPARDSSDAALTGNVSFTFDEDVSAVPGSTLFIELYEGFSPFAAQRLPATLSGRTLSATLATPLLRNTSYEMRLSGSVQDARGQVSSGAAIGVRFRTDPGPLARPQALIAGLTSFSARRTDFDGDGRPDLLVVGNEAGSTQTRLYLWPGLAAGGFGTPRALLELNGSGIGCEARDIAIGDVDGNGLPDVAAACGPFLFVYRQTAPGVFVSERPGFNGGMGLTARDLDGDGRAELLLVGTPPGADVATQRSWFVIGRQPDGRWLSLANIELGGAFAFAFGAGVADLDNDGRPDLVWVRKAGDGTHELAWAPGRPGATFAATLSWPIGNRPGAFSDMAVADIDGDGRADVVAAGVLDTSLVAVLRGRPGGGFGDTQWLEAGPQAFGVQVADVDGDGRRDVVVSHTFNAFVGVFLQDATGNLQAERRFEIQNTDYIGGASLLTLDFNGDGRIDLLAQGDLLLARPFTGAWPASAAPRPTARLLRR